MADVKQYAYYVRGRELAIVEVDTETLPDGDTYGDTLWKSPVTTADNGLLLEYVARPKAKDGGDIVDESDEPDIGDLYLKALVYYVKARVAEDQLLIDQKEYFMKQFFTLLDRSENNKIHTVRKVSTPGIAAIR